MKKGLLALVCVALLAPSLSALATWRGDKRQDARDIRRIAASKVVIPSRNASAITIKATPAAVTINGKTAAKVARKHVTKNGETKASASPGRHSSRRRSL
ncbi:TPA: hypothetical protein ACXG3V_001187 [Klebsiella variicola]